MPLAGKGMFRGLGDKEITLAEGASMRLWGGGVL
jgi:hypothetical protein